MPTRPPGAPRIEHRETEVLIALQTNFFTVPRFQRSYVWSDPQVSDFSSDLWDGFENRKPWFVGTIVLAKGQKLDRLGQAQELIDGQQRVTTLFVWLASLRDECRGRGIDDLAKFIDDTYIWDRSPMAPPDGQPRLSIGDGVINSYFQSLVIDGHATREPMHGSEERIRAAMTTFRETITKKLDEAAQPAADLVQDLLQWLRESMHAFFAIAPDLASASKLFDLLNSRGRPLEPSDLLKSYLFAITNGAAASEWASVAQLFDPVAADADAVPEIDTFVRHQWFSRHPIPADKRQRGAPSQRATQELIRADTSARRTALDYVGNLKTDAEVYIQLARPTQHYWDRKIGRGGFEALQDLNVIKVEVFRPLILAVVRKFDSDEQALFLRSLLSWAFRKKVVTFKLGSGEDEERYFTAAYQVSIGAATSTKAILELLDIPDDTRFRQAFRNLNITQKQARFVLGRLEDALDKVGERSTNWTEMTLEHVLPDRPQLLDDWPTFNEEQHRSLRYNIGNLTLLRRVPNERAGRGPFQSKKIAYANSALEITRTISGKYADWTPVSIEHRAEWLAEAGLAAFPLLAVRRR
jgi:hypothetical protein